MGRIACIALLLIGWTTHASANGVGFTRIVIEDPVGGEMTVSVWYPTSMPGGEISVGPYTFSAAREAKVGAGRHGLVVISHGTAGSDLGHRNVAIALAGAGIIAAAPLHPRDNFRDSSGVGHRVVMEGRPRQLSAVIDALQSLPKWRDHIDPNRIGAFGFSLGGYTVLAALGAAPEMSNIVDHCARTSADPFCRLVGRLDETARKAVEVEVLRKWPDVTDPRICAASIADPVAVPFSDRALAGIGARYIQIWRPEAQNVLLAAAHASRAVRMLNSRPHTETTEEIVVPGAQHFSFLAPFPLRLQQTLPRELTKDSSGFDRATFQARFASRVAEFLKRSLARCRGEK